MDEAYDAVPPRLELERTSSFDNLERIVELTQGFAEHHLEDDDLVYRVVLLVSEAVTNAMKHGNQFDEGKRIRLLVTVMPDRVVICVQDEGEGFDPDTVENPLQNHNLMRESGRGIFLMQRMADVVRYDRDQRKLCLELLYGKA